MVFKNTYKLVTTLHTQKKTTWFKSISYRVNIHIKKFQWWMEISEQPVEITGFVYSVA